MLLTKGANAAVPTTPLALDVSVDRSGVGIDVSALLLGVHGKVRGDADLVFFNQPAGADGAVTLSETPAGYRVDVDPGRLPADVAKVAVTASIDVDEPSTASFGDVRGLRVTVSSAEAEHGFAPTFESGERAGLLIEVYRRGADWKVRAIGQGWATGFAGLATDFGVDIDPEPDPAPAGGATSSPAATPAPGVVPVLAAPAPPAEPAPAPAAAMSRVSLGKVVLEKSGSATISLDEDDRTVEVVATLEWDGGSTERREQGADLDLYALFVPRLEAGEKKKRRFKKSARVTGDPSPGAAVYHANLGSLSEAPFVQHAGDATAPGVETVRIRRPDQQGYVLICAYSALSNGEGSFRSFRARAVVTDGRGSTVVAPLFNDSDNSYWAALALIDFTVAGGVAISHVETYGGEHQEARPTLHADGSFTMDTGPVEFKDFDFDDFDDD